MTQPLEPVRGPRRPTVAGVPAVAPPRRRRDEERQRDARDDARERDRPAPPEAPPAQGIVDADGHVDVVA